MPIEDIDKEMNQVKAIAAAAFKAFDEEDFVTSGKQLLLSAEKLKIMYAPEHPDVLKCLLMSGDSYYYLDRFSDAAKAYLQVLSTVETVSSAQCDLSVLYFKIAKTLERAKRFDEAEKHYEKAVSVCEKTLSTNHPLRTIVLESYGSFLRHIRKNPRAAAAVEERAAVLRAKNKEISGLYENFLEPLKRRQESIHSSNLHERHSLPHTSARSEQSKDVDALVFRPVEKTPGKTDLKLFGTRVAAVLLSVGLIVFLIITAGRIAQSSYFKIEEDEPMMAKDDFCYHGSFDPMKGSLNDSFLRGWDSEGVVAVMHSAKSLTPSNGVNFVNLGWTGKIRQTLFLDRKKNYVLMFDVATPEPDADPVVLYSFNNREWQEARVPSANAWHTIKYSFSPRYGQAGIFISGYPKGSTEKFVDNVRIYLSEQQPN